MNKEWIIEKLKSFKIWLFSLGIGTVAVILWLIIKAIICATTGICIIF